MRKWKPLCKIRTFDQVKLGDVFRHFCDPYRFIVTDKNDYFIYAIYNCGFTEQFSREKWETLRLNWRLVKQNRSVTVSVA